MNNTKTLQVTPGRLHVGPKCSQNKVKITRRIQVSISALTYKSPYLGGWAGFPVRASDQAFAMVFFISSSPSSYMFCWTQNVTNQDNADAWRTKNSYKTSLEEDGSVDFCKFKALVGFFQNHHLKWVLLQWIWHTFIKSIMPLIGSLSLSIAGALNYKTHPREQNPNI